MIYPELFITLNFSYKFPKVSYPELPEIRLERGPVEDANETNRWSWGD